MACVAPLRSTSTSRRAERALTTDAPTPCRPPEAAYDPPPNLPPHVQLGHDDLDAGEAGLGLDVHGDAAAVVPDLHGGVLVEDHLDVVAVPAQGLIDGIVDDLPQAVHEATAVGGPDIHAGALADGLQSFEDEQVPRGVVGAVPVCSGQQCAGRHGRVGGHAVRSSLNFFSGPVGRSGGSAAAGRVPRPGRADATPPQPLRQPSADPHECSIPRGSEANITFPSTHEPFSVRARPHEQPALSRRGQNCDKRTT